MENPYAPPSAGADAGDFADRSEPDDDARRRAHLVAEGRVRAAGLLLVLQALVMVASTTLVLSVLWRLDRPSGDPRWFGPSAVLVMPAVVVSVLLASGLGVRRFHPLARWVGTAASVFLLIGFPAGTIIGLAVLSQLWAPASGPLFTRHHRDLVRRTPHLRSDERRPTLVAVGIAAVAIAAGVARSFLF